MKAFGLVGQLFMIAVFMEGFSMDSFGLPYLWISLALVISVFRLSKSAQREEGTSHAVEN